MKAYKAWDSEAAENCSTVVFAETARRAKVIAFGTETCEGANYTDIRVRRFPEMDGHDRGRREIDWYDPEDRKALVALGWTCIDTSWECDTCECKSACIQWEDEEAESPDFLRKDITQDVSIEKRAGKDTQMKNIKELPDRMAALIEAVEEASQGQDAPVFTPQAIEIVKEIAAYSKTTKAYQQQAERAADFWARPHTPADVWLLMLDRIFNAPFAVYRDAAVLWHMPALEKAIEEAADE